MIPATAPALDEEVRSAGTESARKDSGSELIEAVRSASTESERELGQKVVRAIDGVLFSDDNPYK